MLLVALTGNIASGKSTVAAQFQAHGAVIVDSDVLAREAVAPGTQALAEIVAHWGPSVLNHDGSLDRAALRSRVFSDEHERSVINAIVHPRVETLRQARVNRARDSGAEVVVCDIPLLFEVGLEGSFDCIILVDAPEATRLERLTARRGLGRESARQMLAAQRSTEAKRARADYIIDNTESLQKLQRDVDALWEILLARARCTS